MTLNIKELEKIIKKEAESDTKEHEPFPNIDYRQKHKSTFITGANFGSQATIEHLSKGGEHKEFWLQERDCPMNGIGYMVYLDKAHAEKMGFTHHVIDHAALISANAKIAALEEQKKNLIQRENELQQRNKELEAKVELQRENSIEADRNFQSSFAMISSNLKEALEILKYIHDRDLQEEINSVWDKVDSFLSKRGGG